MRVPISFSDKSDWFLLDLYDTSWSCRQNSSSGYCRDVWFSSFVYFLWSLRWSAKLVLGFRLFILTVKTSLIIRSSSVPKWHLAAKPLSTEWNCSSDPLICFSSKLIGKFRKFHSAPFFFNSACSVSTTHWKPVYQNSQSMDGSLHFDGQNQVMPNGFFSQLWPVGFALWKVASTIVNSKLQCK